MAADGAQPVREAEQVVDRDGEVVVGVHQPGVGGDDAVPVGVGVVPGGDVVGRGAARLRRHDAPERGHGRRRRAVHPDLAVPVQGHERPARVDVRVDDGEVEAVPLADGAPVVDGGAAERVRPDPHAGGADGLDVDHALQVVDVRGEEVVLAGGRRLERGFDRHPRDLVNALADDLVGAVGDPARRVRVGGPAVGRVVLEAAVARRVVRRRDDDAVGQAGAGGADAGRGAGAVRREDRVRDGGGGRVGVARVDPDLDAGRCQHLERRLPGGERQAVGVAADVQRAVRALAPPVLDDRRGDGDDVRLVEGGVEARPPVTRGAEQDLLHGVVHVGDAVVVRRHQRVDVDEVFGEGDLASAWVHEADPATGPRRRGGERTTSFGQRRRRPLPPTSARRRGARRGALAAGG